MKFPIPLPEDGRTHEYCLSCQAETVVRLSEGEKMIFKCGTCGRADNRSFYFDGRKAWLQPDGELWHATAGIFVRSASGRYLFFERTRFSPFGLTIPAGHVDRGETAEEAAYRELAEETGIRARDLHRVTESDLLHDPCSAGADAHRWHVYLTTECDECEVSIQAEEGTHPVWLSLDEARGRDLVPGTRTIIDRYHGLLSAAIPS